MEWEPLAVLAALWLAAGMTCAATIYRRGHDGWHWMTWSAAAGPLAFILVEGQARNIEGMVERRRIAHSGRPRPGTTVVVPASAVGAIDARTLDRLGVSVGNITVATTVAYENSDGVAWDDLQDTMRATEAEACLRFAPHPVELVVLPGNTAEAIAGWAADHPPAVIITTRGAHHPRTLGRLTMRAAEARGVSTIVLDPTSLTAGRADGVST